MVATTGAIPLSWNFKHTSFMTPLKRIDGEDFKSDPETDLRVQRKHAKYAAQVIFIAAGMAAIFVWMLCVVASKILSLFNPS